MEEDWAENLPTTWPAGSSTEVKRRPNTKERNLNLPSKVSGMPSKNPEDEMLRYRQPRDREPNIHRPPVLSRVRPAVSRVKMLPKREQVVNSTIKW